jgi:dTDP-4-amino-4,6-dideoxygalactose transaminase
MNVDAKKVEEAITPKTKAIVIVHYAGVSCDMDTFMSLRERYKIPIVEDAAQAVLAKHKNQYLGTIGDLGCFSFHETKNINCGEGGALSVNNNAFFERAEILREKGTNRSRFHRGQVDKYTWMDLGSSFLMNELSAAFLLAQLEQAKEITKKRCEIWNKYQRALLPLEKSGFIELQQVPSYAAINGHLFYMKLKNESIRAKFIAHMEKANVATVFHYIPLHISIFSCFYICICFSCKRFSLLYTETMLLVDNDERQVLKSYRLLDKGMCTYNKRNAPISKP